MMAIVHKCVCCVCVCVCMYVCVYMCVCVYVCGGFSILIVLVLVYANLVFPIHTSGMYYPV